jgi:uncharacterized membrane protein YfcA
VRAGALAGIVSGLIGVGGGVVLVPAMVSRRVGLNQREAAGTSLVGILPIALVGAATYAGHRDIDGLASLCVIPGSVIGAVAGARLSRRISDRSLAIAFATLCLLVALRLAIPVGLPSGGGPVSVSATHVIALVATGVGAGLASGLLGIGGGILLVPILVLGFGVSQQLAQGTSLAAIIPTGLSGAVAHWRLRHVNGAVAATMALPGAAGAVVGALLATRLPETPLRLMFAAYLTFTAVRLLKRAA